MRDPDSIVVFSLNPHVGELLGEAEHRPVDFTVPRAQKPTPQVGRELVVSPSVVGYVVCTEQNFEGASERPCKTGKLLQFRKSYLRYANAYTAQFFKETVAASLPKNSANPRFSSDLARSSSCEERYLVVSKAGCCPREYHVEPTEMFRIREPSTPPSLPHPPPAFWNGVRYEICTSWLGNFSISPLRYLSKNRRCLHFDGHYAPRGRSDVCRCLCVHCRPLPQPIPMHGLESPSQTVRPASTGHQTEIGLPSGYSQARRLGTVSGTVRTCD